MRLIPRQLSLRWIRRHQREALAAAAIALGVAAVVIGLVMRSGGDSAPAAASEGTGSIQRPQQVDTYVPPTGREPGSPLADDMLRQGFSALAGPAGGLGLAGSGGTKGLPRHTVVLRMSSSAPMGELGYVVPTSPDASYGVVKDAGRSWSLTTIAYGSPDYAQLFGQAGPGGAALTCTITVDGTVTEQRSTDGPYGQLFCQG